MENIWKVKNTTEINIKIAVASKNTTTKGVILKPGQFCLCEGRMTSSMDAQERRKFILVDREFNNSENLNLAEADDVSNLDLAKEKTEGYSK